MIRYINHFKKEHWWYTLAINAPIIDYNLYGNIEPLLEEAYQKVPDFTIAFNYEDKWGHLRLSSIIRNF